MKDIKIGTHILTIYDSIQDMPIKRHNQLNLYLLKDSGIPATVQGVSDRFKVFFKLLKEKDLSMLQTEAANIAYSLNSILEGINYGHYSFLCFIQKIDGVEVRDVTNEDYCNQLLKNIGDWLTVGNINDISNDVKKKIAKELKLFFPEKYDNLNELLYFQQLKRKVEIQLKRIIQQKPELYEAQLITVEKYFLSLETPKELRAIKGNVMIEHINYFELLCTLLEENGISKPKELTVFEFMSRVNYIELKFKKK